MREKLYGSVFFLAVFTIVYNFIEGLLSIWLGIADETLALFGFGVDSFVEVISGVGILQMVIRIRKNPHSPVSIFEKRALTITGIAFFILTAGLMAGATVNLITGHRPETTVAGIVISVISLAIMGWLYISKIKYGKKLNAAPVIADGKCTLVCIYMSLVLLFSSLIYALSGIWWIDVVGALGLSWLSFSEGKEAFEKARGEDCC